jgi:hypothetical protein
MTQKEPKPENGLVLNLKRTFFPLKGGANNKRNLEIVNPDRYEGKVEFPLVQIIASDRYNN